MDYSLLLAVEKNPDFSKLWGTKGPNDRNFSYDTNQFSQTTDAEGGDKQGTDLLCQKTFKKTRHKFLSKSGRFIYHLGIIDYLQEYNFDKKMENFFKISIL